jgi:hypothetical protein
MTTTKTTAMTANVSTIKNRKRKALLNAWGKDENEVEFEVCITNLFLLFHDVVLFFVLFLFTQ